jgi:hypothetical protein
LKKVCQGVHSLTGIVNGEDLICFAACHLVWVDGFHRVDLQPVSIAFLSPGEIRGHLFKRTPIRRYNVPPGGYEMVVFGPISLLAMGIPDVRKLKGELLAEPGALGALCRLSIMKTAVREARERNTRSVDHHLRSPSPALI